MRKAKSIKRKTKSNHDDQVNMKQIYIIFNFKDPLILPHFYSNVI